MNYSANKPKFYILDENLDVEALKRDNDCYIVARSGIYHKLKTSLYNYILPVRNLNHLKPIKTYGKMNIPKIPLSEFAKVVKFFHDVYCKLKTECMVLLYYNYQEKKLDIRAPEYQHVTSGSITYQTKPPTGDGYILIGSIHSHGSMGAFHSSRDKSDEMDFDGLHITLGEFDEDDYYFNFSSELVIAGNRNKYDIKDWLEGELKPVERTIKTPYYQNFEGWYGYYGLTGYDRLCKPGIPVKPTNKIEKSKSKSKKSENITKPETKTKNNLNPVQRAANKVKEFLISTSSGKAIKVNAKQKDDKVSSSAKVEFNKTKQKDKKKSQTNFYVKTEKLLEVGYNLNNQKYPGEWSESVEKYIPKTNIQTKTKCGYEHPSYLAQLFGGEDEDLVSTKDMKDIIDELFEDSDQKDLDEGDLEQNVG